MKGASPASEVASLLESVPSSGIAAKRENADWTPTPFVWTSKVVAESRVGDFLAKMKANR